MDNKDNGKSLIRFLHSGIFILPLISFLISMIFVILVIAFKINPGLFNYFAQKHLDLAAIIIAGASFVVALLSALGIIHPRKQEDDFVGEKKSGPFWPSGSSSEFFTLPELSSKEYPFNDKCDADTSIKWRREALSDISGILSKKDSVVIYGKSGDGKSIILWQFLKYIKWEQDDEVSPELNDCIQSIKICHPEFRYQFSKGKFPACPREERHFLILDQIDELSESELQNLLQKAKGWLEINGKLNTKLTKKRNKLLVCAKSSSLGKVCNAFSMTQDGMANVDMYNLKLDDNLISRLRPGGEKKVEQKTDARKIMECLHKKMKADEISLIEYQFVNRLYDNELMNELLKDMRNVRLKEPEKDEELVTDICVAYFNRKLKDIPCDAYIAYLSFLRILSDNAEHSTKKSESITMFSENHLKIFADDLVQEKLLIKNGEDYRTSHEWVGRMFQQVTRALLSGENVDVLDTIRAGFSEYKQSLEDCFKNFQESSSVNVCIILCSIASAGFSLWMFGSLCSSFPLSMPSYSELILWLSAEIAVYVGTLYIGNFYRHCANIVRSHRKWMYFFGVMAAMLPFVFLKFAPSFSWLWNLECAIHKAGNIIRHPSCPWRKILGLMGFAAANSSIGFFI